MKICYVNPHNNIRRPIAELANILAEEGHEISIMYPISKDCPTKNWVANDAIKNPKIKRIPISSFYLPALRYNLPNLLQLYRETKKIYQENDKVHIWEYFYPLSVVPLLHASFNRQRKKKTILTTDGFVGYSYKPKNPWWLVPTFRIYTQSIARFLFKVPEKITTYGNAMLPYAKKAGVPMKKLQVIPTGIHLDKFKQINKQKVIELRKEFNLKEEKVILFVGMLTERKGIRKVISISQRLLDEGLNLKTILVGDAHGLNSYLKLVRPEDKDKIIFTGGRKEIPEFMHLADVLLLPSEGEGLPGAVMEAMASGLPVVATNEGCTPDLIEKQLLSKTNEKYCLVIKNIFNNNYPIKKNNNKIKQFEWKIVSKEYCELYQNGFE